MACYFCKVPGTEHARAFARRRRFALVSGPTNTDIAIFFPGASCAMRAKPRLESKYGVSLRLLTVVCQVQAQPQPTI